MNRTIYINRKDIHANVETVDEFNQGRKHGKEMLKEYRLSDPYAHYYISQRPCKAWLEDSKENEDDTT